VSENFFAELEIEFLAEAAFMLEQYEESMLGLESGRNRDEDLAAIFRVAHSVKGGASAVGFHDLGKFAHAMEDLLAILRVNPQHINEDVISALLESGDMLKKRVHALQTSESSEWNTMELEARLIGFTQKFGGQTAVVANSVTTPVNAPVVAHGIVEDHTNYELLAELQAELKDASSALLQEATAGMAPTPVIERVFDKVDDPEKPEGSEKSDKVERRNLSARGIASSIKVDTARVDSVLDAVGELVVLKNQLVHDDAVRNGDNARLAAIVDQLDKSVRELYDKTLSIRMTPLKSLFLKIQRIVRDVSISLGKPVDLQLIGEETEVERTVFELLGDPLVHLVRNAMDHGLERPEIRKENGKNPTGKIWCPLSNQVAV
jgi:two-component system chemotaxis sensor kinase CheA